MDNEELFFVAQNVAYTFYRGGVFRVGFVSGCELSIKLDREGQKILKDAIVKALGTLNGSVCFPLRPAMSLHWAMIQ